MDMPEFEWQTQYTQDQPTPSQSAIQTWSGSSLSHPVNHFESDQLQVEQSQPGSSSTAHGYVHNHGLGYDNQGDSPSNVLGHASDGMQAAFDHGDVHAGSSTSHRNYDGYPNTQSNFNDFQLHQSTQSHGPGFQLSVAGYTPIQVSGTLNDVPPLQVHNHGLGYNNQGDSFSNVLGHASDGLQAVFDRGDVHAGSSTSHHNYDGYPNTQATSTTFNRSSQPSHTVLVSNSLLQDTLRLKSA
ncbi:hypothetical protein EV702DRAFT_1077647, partial [Suillus placidus]